MAYIINKTNGEVFATVNDGTINTDSSQVIVGKNYAGYGEFLGENFIRLLENGANVSAPANPLTGQLWFDINVGVLKVYNGGTWKNLGSASTGQTAPDSPVQGDLWYDPTNKQLFVYDASDAGWLLVGPSFTAGTGISGAIVDSIQDDSGNDHVVVKLYVEDKIVAIISKDDVFNHTDSTLSGFDSIGPGIQMTTDLSLSGHSYLFEGTARSALGIVDVSGNSKEVLFADGSNTLGGDLLPTLVDSINLGAPQQYYNTIYATNFIGTASAAQYADLAERFEVDKALPAGTVVELGGEKEITQAQEKLSDNVFGVISTSAAYLMNCDAGENDTHPPVAMSGRVPVRVIGKINKGDRLVSAGNGLAQSAQIDEITPFNVIGRALENKTTDGEGVVEAIVRIN